MNVDLRVVRPETDTTRKTLRAVKCIHVLSLLQEYLDYCTNENKKIFRIASVDA
jgi:hypothetical protein